MFSLVLHRCLSRGRLVAVPRHINICVFSLGDGVLSGTAEPDA